ncbi:hypothetical protein MXB_622 [Myxobolus squamalis]|nr:hypothetical protein MXB_622 [Myxobolus squamalis]
MNILSIGYYDKIHLFLQGLLPIFVISLASIYSFIPTNFAFIFCIDKNINIYKIEFQAKIPNLIDIHYALELIYSFKINFNKISEYIDFINCHYYEKLIPFIKTLQNISADKCISTEFCRIFYFGRISPELLHLLAEKSTAVIITNSLIVSNNLPEVWNYIVKIQYMTEKLLSICQSLKSIFKSNKFFNQIEEFDLFCIELNCLYKWTFEILKAHHFKNVIDSWRIFIVWLAYLKEFVCKENNQNKVYNISIFDKISDIGNDIYIRNILINFITNDLNDYIQNSSRFNLIPFSLDPLKLSLNNFEKCFEFYFSRDLSLPIPYKSELSLDYHFFVSSIIDSIIVVSIISNDKSNIFLLKIDSSSSKCLLECFEMNLHNSFQNIFSIFTQSMKLLILLKDNCQTYHFNYLENINWSHLDDHKIYDIETFTSKHANFETSDILSLEYQAATHSIIASNTSNYITVIDVDNIVFDD